MGKKGVCVRKGILIATVILFLQGILFSQEKIQIATTDFPPYQSEFNGKLNGISVELVQCLIKNAGLVPVIKIYPWKRAEMLLNSTEILFFNLSRTTERDSLYQWIADIAPTNIYIWKLKTNKSTVLKESDLVTYTFATLNGDACNKYLKTIIPENHIHSVATDEQLVLMLKSSRIDFCPCPSFPIPKIELRQVSSSFSIRSPIETGIINPLQKKRRTKIWTFSHYLTTLILRRTTSLMI